MAHSEYNPSDAELVHFLQIWIEPAAEQRGQKPVYHQLGFAESERRGRLCLVASGDGRDGSIRIRQDAAMYVTQLGPGEAATLPLREKRAAWVHVATGSVSLNEQRLGSGDGAAVEGELELRIAGRLDASAPAAEVVVFDLP
jgi:redox-sensitive bicupin YhaK (pirin superfamily)